MAFSMPLTSFLWPYFSDRLSPWYPNTWLTIPDVQDSAESLVVHLGSEMLIASSSEPGQWELIDIAELNVCTYLASTLSDQVADWESTPWSLFRDQECTSVNAADDVLGVFPDSCQQLQSAAEVQAITTLAAVSSFDASFRKESTAATAVSAVTASAGAAVNAGVSAAIGQAAASAGEIGQAVLSSGGGVGLAPVLDGLQSLGISARLPVRHARLVYSLASGVSWYATSLYCFHDT